MSASSPYDPQVSLETWTDGLPVCKQCGVGYQTNQLYKEGGGRLDNHESEDRFVHRKCQQSICSLYGIFDGHDGAHVADFAAQRLPAELLLGQLEAHASDEDVKVALKNAFEGVENGYHESIDDVLVQKFNLQAQLPEDMGSYEAVRRFPSLVQRLHSIEKEISGGSTAVVALIHNTKCWVANVGDARALLCTVGPSDELSVHQLSIDHTLSNQDECDRLAASNWDTDTIGEHMMGNIGTTRSFGDYCIKAGFQEMDSTRKGTKEPIIAEPSIWFGQNIDPSYYFLALMSSGLYKAIEEVTDARDANVEVVNMIVSELPHQSTIQGLAQAVVDKVCRMHQDCFSQTDGKRCRRRGDMTLLLRLFNAQLGRPGSTASSPTSPIFHPVSIPYTGSNTKPSLSLIMPAGQTSSGTPSPSMPTPDSTGSETTPPTAYVQSASTLQASFSAMRMTNAQHGPIVNQSVVADQHCGDNGSGLKPLVLNLEELVDTGASEQLLVRGSMEHGMPHGNEGGDDGERIAAWNRVSADMNNEQQADSSSGEDRTQFLNKGPLPMEIGADKKVAAYVDFSDFISKMEVDGGEACVLREFMKERR